MRAICHAEMLDMLTRSARIVLLICRRHAARGSRAAYDRDISRHAERAEARALQQAWRSVQVAVQRRCASCVHDAVLRHADESVYACRYTTTAEYHAFFFCHCHAMPPPLSFARRRRRRYTRRCRRALPHTLDAIRSHASCRDVAVRRYAMCGAE